MSTTLGLAIGHDAVRAVAVRGGTPVWVAEATMDGLGDLEDVVVQLVDAAPRPRLRRTPVRVAVGPSRAQVRRVERLPPMDDPRSLARIVQEGARRFFLRNGARLVTSGVRVVERGVVWAAAFEEPTIRAVEEACAAAHLRLQAILPAAIVLPAAVEGDRLYWPDGPITAEVRCDDGDVTEIRRTRRSDATAGDDALRPVRSLAAVGESGWRFADAFGAAISSDDEPLAVRPGRSLGLGGDVPRWRAVAAGAAALGGAMLLVAVPGVLANRASQQAAAALQSIANERAAAVASEAALQRFSHALDVVAAFADRRRSATLFLDELGAALPEGGALVMVRADSAGGMIVAVAPRAAELVRALEDVAVVTGPEIVGPVLREQLAGELLERITVRFRFVPPDGDQRRAAASSEGQ